VEETYFVIERSLCFVAGVVVGRESAKQLGGPIRIAEVAGDAWNAGLDSGGIGTAITYLLNLSAFLSASIGLLNLFPIPLLDGGHLLFYGIEALRGRPLSERAQEVGFRIGLAIVVMLMIFAAYNDISGILHRLVS
jgi:regulator of sigma E protease